MTDCFLTFSGPISKQTVHSLVVDLIEYVLFYRGQIPWLLNQKKRAKESDFLKGTMIDAHKIPGKTDDVKEFGNVLVYVDAAEPPHNQVKRQDRATQLFKESLSRFDTFFQDLLSILQCNPVSELVLKLGPSFPAPEIYHIKLPARCEVAECNVDSIPIRKCRSQLYEALFRCNLPSTLIEKPLSISVMLHLLPGTKLSCNLEYKKHYTIPKSAKCKLMSFNCNCNHISNSTATNVTMQHQTTSCTDIVSDDTPLWVLFKPELKGIPKKKSVGLIG